MREREKGGWVCTYRGRGVAVLLGAFREFYFLFLLGLRNSYHSYIGKE